MRKKEVVNLKDHALLKTRHEGDETEETKRVELRLGVGGWKKPEGKKESFPLPLLPASRKAS